MPLTYFYAQLFGLVILIVGVAMLVNRRAMLTMIHELLEDRALLAVVGIMTLFLGIIVVLTHNVWTGGMLPVLVTVLGWAFILRACLVLFLPHGALRNLLASFKLEQTYYLVTLAAIIVGIFLTYYGFAIPGY